MKMYDELCTFLSELPEIFISQNTKLSDLENLKTGTYKINQCLPISLFEELPYFNNSSGEIGIIFVDNNWLLLISSHAGVQMPFKLSKYLKKGAVQFCAHSHPYDGKFNNTDTPSIRDLEAKDIEGLTYIISKEGFTEIDISQLTPAHIKYIEEVETEYAGKIDSNEYLIFMNALYDRIGLHRRRISYEDKKQIMDIFVKKRNLKTPFWDDDVVEHKTPFPGFCKR